MKIKCPCCKEEEEISLKLILFDRCPHCGGRIDRSFSSKSKTIRFILHAFYIAAFTMLLFYSKEFSNLLHVSMLIWNLIALVIFACCFLLTEFVRMRIDFRSN